MPSLKSGPAHKLARPFKGLFRVVAVHPNGAEVVLVEKPRSSPIRVAFNRLRWCPKEVPEDHSHPSEVPKKSQSKGTKDDATRDQASATENNANEEAGSSVGIRAKPTDGHGGGQGEQPNAATVAEAPSQVDTSALGMTTLMTVG